MKNERGQFKKNNPGRKPGTKNKKTEQWEQLSDFMCNAGAEKAKTELLKMKGQAYVQAYERLVRYFKPAMRTLDVTGFEHLSDETIDTITNRLIEKAKENEKIKRAKSETD